MLQFDGAALFRTMQFLNHIDGIIEGMNNFENVQEGNVGNGFSPYLENIDRLLVELKRLEVPLSVKSAEKLRNLIATDSDPKVMTIRQFISELSGRLPDELSSKMLLAMPDFSKKYLMPESPLFGEIVEEVFPGASEDIAEAAACMVFARYTAGVFHLMRAMETAVQTLSEKLGIERTELEWGKLLSSMKDKIEPMAKGQMRDRWSENHSLLYHVKQAWRNNTMHPKQTYTEDEAWSVYDAVKSFLGNLALLVKPEEVQPAS